MRAVNLLTYDPGISAGRLPALPKPSPGVAGGIVASLLALALGVTYLGASRAVNERQTELTAVALEERALAARVAGAQNEQALVEREQRDAALTAVLADRVAWDKVLRDVARVLPPQVSVTSLTAQAPRVPAAAVVAPTAEGTGAPTGLALTGVALNQPTVALVLDRLALLPALLDIQLQSSTKTAVGTRTARSFTIVANINQEGSTR